jgi:hypothetical protein
VACTADASASGNHIEKVVTLEDKTDSSIDDDSDENEKDPRLPTSVYQSHGLFSKEIVVDRIRVASFRRESVYRAPFTVQLIAVDRDVAIEWEWELHGIGIKITIEFGIRVCHHLKTTVDEK